MELLLSVVQYCSRNDLLSIKTNEYRIQNTGFIDKNCYSPVFYQWPWSLVMITEEIKHKTWYKTKKASQIAWASSVSQNKSRVLKAFNYAILASSRLNGPCYKDKCLESADKNHLDKYVHCYNSSFNSDNFWSWDVL